MEIALNKMKNGLIAGTRVIVGNYDRFLTTSCVRHLSFLNCVDNGFSDNLHVEVSKYLTEQLGHSLQSTYRLLGVKSMVPTGNDAHTHERNVIMRKNSVRGAIRKSRSSGSNEGFTIKRKHSPSSNASSEDLKPTLSRRDSTSFDYDYDEIVSFEERQKYVKENRTTWLLLPYFSCFPEQIAREFEVFGA